MDMNMAVLAIVLITVFASIELISASTSDCIDKGFNSNVLCSSCDDLGRFDLTPLKDDCTKCCQTMPGVEKVCNVLLYHVNNLLCFVSQYAQCLTIYGLNGYQIHFSQNLI